MSILKEFKEFAMRGNVVDLAIGLMVGTAFTKVVTSFVNDILMPPLGLVIGKMDFSNLFINLSGKDIRSVAEAKAQGAATINYGLFINTLIDFLIMAAVIFFLVRFMNARRKKEETTAKDCPFCFRSIPEQASRCPQCTSMLKEAAVS